MRWLVILLLGAAMLVPACKTSHEVEIKPTEHTIRVEPIKVTVDINVKVQVEKELEDVFDFREDLSGGEEAGSGEGGK